jgi:hypothetical protein
MSAEGGPAPGLQEIPPAPTTYRYRGKEPSGHGFHMYMPLRDLEYTASRQCPSLAMVTVLLAFAHRTDVDGVTRTGPREIARHLDRSPGTVQGHVKRLIELGFLEKLGGCRVDNRHRLWRVAGMYRRDKVKTGPGENQHRDDARPRGGSARHPATSRGGSARIPALLPGELIEPTRVSPRQEPAEARDWGRVNDPAGIGKAREALWARRAAGGAPGASEPPATASDASAVPDAVLGAQSATEDGIEGVG